MYSAGSRAVDDEGVETILRSINPQVPDEKLSINIPVTTKFRPERLVVTDVGLHDWNGVLCGNSD